VHSQYGKLFAAVRFPDMAGKALAAVQVRFHCASVSRFQIELTACGQELYSELMPEDARIGKKRLISPISMKIRAAYTNAANAYYRLAGTGLPGHIQLDTGKSLRFLKDDCFHAVLKIFILQQSRPRLDHVNVHGYVHEYLDCAASLVIPVNQCCAVFTVDVHVIVS
jgi:hypothetical protein